jgi:hypothetical protein
MYNNTRGEEASPNLKFVRPAEGLYAPPISHTIPSIHSDNRNDPNLSREYDHVFAIPFFFPVPYFHCFQHFGCWFIFIFISSRERPPLLVHLRIELPLYLAMLAGVMVALVR